MAPTNTLQELIIAAHLKAPTNFTVVDLANFAQFFSVDFPIVQELPPLAAVSLALNQQQLQFQLMAQDHIPHPRILLRSPDGRFSVQVQGDRFGFGWHRTEPLGEPSAYPGFEAVERDWEKYLGAFERWMKDRFHQNIELKLLEITYNNAAPFEHKGQTRRISDIFKFVRPGNRPLNGFLSVWTESVSGDPSEARVTAQVNLGSAPPDKSVLAFVFAGVGAVASSGDRRQILNDIHAKIRQMYADAINSDDT